MEYRKILEVIAQKEQISPQEVEEEMKRALQLAGVPFSPQEVIQSAVTRLKRTIYSTNV